MKALSAFRHRFRPGGRFIECVVTERGASLQNQHRAPRAMEGVLGKLLNLGLFNRQSAPRQHEQRDHCMSSLELNPVKRRLPEKIAVDSHRTVFQICDSMRAP